MMLYNRYYYTCTQVIAEITRIRNWYTESYGGYVDFYHPVFQIFDKAISPIIDELDFKTQYTKTDLDEIIKRTYAACNNAV